MNASTEGENPSFRLLPLLGYALNEGGWSNTLSIEPCCFIEVARLQDRLGCRPTAKGEANS